MGDKPTLWANRDYWLLWSAYAVSTFGDHVAELSMLGALGYSHRSNPDEKLHLMCWLQLAFFLPYIALGPFNGWLADKLPRRFLMIGADTARAAILAALPLLWFGLILGSQADGIHLWQLSSDPARPIWQGALPYLFIGIFAALFSPSRAAMVPTLVKETELVQGNALLGGAGVIFSGLGFMVGGKLATHVLGPSFWVTSLTFLTSATFVFLIRSRRKPGEAHALSAIGGELAAKKNPPTLAEGWRYMLTHRAIYQTILLTGLFWGLVAAVTNGVAVAAPDEDALGTTLGTFTFGMLAGAIVVNLAGRRIKEPALIVITLVGVGIGLVVYSRFCLEQAGFTARALGLVVGFFAVGVRIAVETLLQRLAPDRIRGRLFGIADLVSMGFFLLVTVGLMLPSRMDAHLPAIFAGCGMLALAVGVYAHAQRHKRRG